MIYQEAAVFANGGWQVLLVIDWFAMLANAAIAPLPRPWRWLFLCEIPLVGVTLVIWLFLPGVYLYDALGIQTPSAADLLLLQYYAGTVATVIFGFYAWLLLQPAVHWPTFRAYQVCLGIGDVIVIAASLAYWSANQRQAALIAQAGVALAWGLLRVAFLISARIPQANA